MKKLIPPVIVLFSLFLFASGVLAQVKVDCWGEFSDTTTKCLKANTQCNINCSDTSGGNQEKNKSCLNSCSSTHDTCNNQATATYNTCIAIQKQPETKQSNPSEVPAPTTSKSSTDYILECWNKQVDGNIVCGKASTQCLIKCSSVDSSGRDACMQQCSDISGACRKPVLAEYDVCIETGKKANQAKPSYIVEIKDFLDKIEKTEQAIDQCPPPRVPSESKCVSDALSQFGLPTYLKDAAIEPDFTNTIVLDESKVQIISLPGGIKEAPSYLMNSITTNLTDFSKEIETVTENPKKYPTINFSPVYTSAAQVSIWPQKIVKSSGLSAVIMSDSKLPYSGHWESLVTLDRDVNNVVTVGGPAVTNVTKMVLDSDAQVTLLDRTNQSVMEVSNGARIVVAGVAADDTLEAARDFISQLSQLRE